MLKRYRQKIVGIGRPRQLLWKEVLSQADRLNRPRTSQFYLLAILFICITTNEEVDDEDL
jgi:hypothetical protein